jgi:hypothetical protein
LRLQWPSCLLSDAVSRRVSIIQLRAETRT